MGNLEGTIIPPVMPLSPALTACGTRPAKSLCPPAPLLTRNVQPQLPYRRQTNSAPPQLPKQVLHDCRADCEALYYQHGIRLAAVWDTQVGG